MSFVTKEIRYDHSPLSGLFHKVFGSPLKKI